MYENNKEGFIVSLNSKDMTKNVTFREPLFKDRWHEEIVFSKDTDGFFHMRLIELFQRASQTPLKINLLTYFFYCGNFFSIEETEVRILPGFDGTVFQRHRSRCST